MNEIRSAHFIIIITSKMCMRSSIMAYEITNVLIDNWPATQLVGHRYTFEDADETAFGHLWEKWNASDRWANLAKLGKPIACVGLMRLKGESFEYWIGNLFAERIQVPEAFESLKFPAIKTATAWIEGFPNEIFGKEPACGAWDAILQKYPNLKRKTVDGWMIELENYTARFDRVNSEGHLTLDYIFFVTD